MRPRRLLGVATIAVLLLGWEVTARAGNNVYVPPPSQIAVTFAHEWFSPQFAQEAVPSIWRLLAGFATHRSSAWCWSGRSWAGRGHRPADHAPTARPAGPREPPVIRRVEVEHHLSGGASLSARLVNPWISMQAWLAR